MKQGRQDKVSNKNWWKTLVRELGCGGDMHRSYSPEATFRRDEAKTWCDLTNHPPPRSRSLMAIKTIEQ